ncbi:uncharacterized protein F4822DRAFT_168188 [Hypoxylon trugodes]|uniref:uncharacterized protein n=1 Tax=Hypoxylon trugodes TaxID=326681 RepID=UPI0021A0BB88|nr:uncharacterized protein F4822DRAFT_168188 [Hypoxylon trugodes]KAI1390965.1 hypothetical protein F4822DRAFT_168188 [Hypoxylon trugodes]
MPPRAARAAGEGVSGSRRTRIKQSKAITQAKRAAKRAETARKKEAARQQEKRRLQREAAKIEAPTHPDDDRAILLFTQTARKRSANMAFDDRDGIKRPMLTPWEKDKELEQPPSPLDLGIGISYLCLNPMAAMGQFGMLPAEIREEILRYLLICPHDIRVFRGWSRVYPRSKPKLDLTILSTCKLLYKQGIRILFGENTFLYDIRDPATHLAATNPVMNRVFADYMVPINKYGHLIRHITVEVPANRLNLDNVPKFTNAIQKFLPGGGLFETASIHTLTLNLPVFRLEDLEGSGWLEHPDSVPILKFVDQSSRTRKILLRLNVQFIRILAMNKDGDIFEHTINLRYYYKYRQAQLAYKRGEIASSDAEGAMEHFQRQVEKAKARISNIPVRLYELATLGLPGANYMGDYWKYAGKQERERRLDETEAQSLPSDYMTEVTPTPAPPSLFSEAPEVQDFDMDLGEGTFEDLILGHAEEDDEEQLFVQDYAEEGAYEQEGYQEGDFQRDYQRDYQEMGGYEERDEEFHRTLEAVLGIA